MILTHLSKEEIEQVENSIFNLAFDLELESGIVINPVLENEAHYRYWLGEADDSLKVADYCLKETNESIYITQNDEGDMVIKSIDTYEKREQLLRLRARVLQAERERIDGAKTMSATEARKNLRERLGEL